MGGEGTYEKEGTFSLRKRYTHYKAQDERMFEMRITVLMDNQTEIDRYFLGEPAVSYWIETQGKYFLFDTAYSAAYLNNGKMLGIDATTADAVILSHGHNDHTGGLPHLLAPAKAQGRKMNIICHPHAVLPKAVGGQDIGCPLSLEQLQEQCILTQSKEPIWLTDQLVFLGEIPRKLAFEPPYTVGMIEMDGVWRRDMVLDDTALAYVGKDGMYLITGCSHAGICNIISYAKEVTGCSDVAGVLGGFHLSALDERSQATIEFLAGEKIAALYPCHCTSFAVKAALHQRSNVKEIGVGHSLQWE